MWIHVYHIAPFDPKLPMRDCDARLRTVRLCHTTLLGLTHAEMVFTMTGTSDKARILLIRPWTAPLAPIRTALRDAGIEARISRVDIEPALNAALQRTRFDVVIYDPATPGITRETLDARMREHRRFAAVIVLELESVADMVRRALAERLN